MTVRLIARSVYALMAFAFLAAGATLLLLGTGLLPSVVAESIAKAADSSDFAMHILQESATLLVLVGLLALWCVLNYERSLYFHWAMTAFWALFSLVHWVDYRGVLHTGPSAFINTIPVAAFVVVGLLRQRSRPRPNASPR